MKDIVKKIILSYKINKIARKIVSELTQEQKKLVDEYTQSRDKNLSFGPLFNQSRTYFSLNASGLNLIQMPKQIQEQIDKQGYYCPDYRQGYVYKKNDKLKSKPVKLLKILSKGKPSNLKELTKKFNERLKSNRKEMIKCMICITYDPYDVAGMSTDRNWTSCMNLDRGEYRDTPLKQVQYGGMCAYLIKESDKNIEEPIARIAIKRLVGKNKNNFIFACENQIYGDVNFAKELNFQKQVVEILHKSNNETNHGQNYFKRKDEDSYSDSNMSGRYYFRNIDELQKMIKTNKKTLLNKDIIESMTEQQIHYFFDKIIEYGGGYLLLDIFEKNIFSNQEKNKLIDSFIEQDDKQDLNFIVLYCHNQVDLTRILDYFIEKGYYGYLHDAIKFNLIYNKDQEQKVIKTLVEHNFYDVKYNDNIVELMNFQPDQKRKVIKALLEYEKVKVLSYLFNELNDKEMIVFIKLLIKKNEKDILSKIIIKYKNKEIKLTDEQALLIIDYYKNELGDKMNDQLKEFFSLNKE